MRELNSLQDGIELVSGIGLNLLYQNIQDRSFKLPKFEADTRKASQIFSWMQSVGETKSS
jgi:hypothetical protein